ncbi:hypothetical protein F5J12DRAFT_703568, partial [Pisolithus orientalis]|uniref:uncharacterized protein n=1 Tax=Pisolithus orientalis TaxID=936130 RepID=UPI00222576E1
LPYHSTKSSEPKLDPKGTTATLNKFLCHAFSPVCATTEYHCGLRSSAQPLSPYVAPPPNAKSILSAFNTPFDPHELEHPVVHPRKDGQAFFVTNGEAFGILDF